MKVYLIKASAHSDFTDYKRSMGGPPQNIFSAAAATPDNVIIEMCDETVDMPVNMRSTADVVAIFMSTPDAPRAYELATYFKQQGKTVVLGGLHVNALPDEALKYADSVLLGEVEGIWPQLLDDLECGDLKSRYRRTQPLDLAKLKPYPTDIIPLQKYEGIWSVVVSRGCPYRCSFCTIPDFFKGAIRYRPVQDVVAEIKACGAKYVELHADNLLVNRSYVEALFTALIPLNIHWIGETSINLAKDEALLDLAVASGLSHVLLGLETPSPEALKGAGKTFFKPEEAKQHIRKFIERGVEVDAAFLFGFDEHDKSIFQKTYQYVKAAAIQSVHSVILIPFPGTRVYREMLEQNRLTTRDWSKYDGSHAVFEPKGMTLEECEQGADWFYRKSGEAPLGYGLYRWLDLGLLGVTLLSIVAALGYYFAVGG